MAISADTISLQPVVAPVAPPPREPAVTPIGERSGASNDRRNDSTKDGRGRANVSFRSFLNAPTFVGLAKTLSRDSAPVDTADDSSARRVRVPKVPARDEAPILSGEESEQLYRSAQTAAQGKNPRAPEFQAATSRYAKSFFSVTGTYARPGESLELTV